MIERYVSPSELRRLLSAFLVVVIFLALLAVFAFLVLPGVRNANAPATDMVASPGGFVTGWLDPTDYPAQAGRTIPPIDPATVMSPTPEMLARGQALFAQNCVSCHGPKGDGDGPAGKGLNPPPRRFTQKDGWVNGFHIDGIYKTLEQGVKGSSMVAYTMLTKRDRMALVHYVRSLGAFDHGPDDPRAMHELAELFAHSGEVIPNRIPVAKAMLKLETEFKAPAALPVDREPALAAAVIDPVRAAQTLSELPGWSGSLETLARGIVPGAPGDGFAPGVALYTGAQWRALQGALKRTVKEEAR